MPDQQLRDQLTQMLEDTVEILDEETVAPFLGTYTNDALGEITLSVS